MPPILAQAAPESIKPWLECAAWLVAMIGGCVYIFRNRSDDSLRQIEPTNNHAVMSELKSQTETLSSIKVDVGVVKKGVEMLEEQMAGMHSRVGSISRDLASTTARVDGLEKREGRAHA